MLTPDIIGAMFGEKLTIEKGLGEGATSQVYFARRRNGEAVVVKVFLRPFVGEEPSMRLGSQPTDEYSGNKDRGGAWHTGLYGSRGHYRKRCRHKE